MTGKDSFYPQKATSYHAFFFNRSEEIFGTGWGEAANTET